MRFEVTITDAVSAVSWTVMFTDDLGEACRRADAERARKRACEVVGVWDTAHDEWIDELEAENLAHDEKAYDQEKRS